MNSIERLRWVGRFEGATLLLLLFVAVPVKYGLGHPEGVSLMGPIHGVSFLLYTVSLIEASSSGVLSKRDSLRTLLACFVPFGPFFNDRVLRRAMTKEAAHP